MFTLSQLQQAHAQVKSGADFPLYIQNLKKLGVQSYDHFVTDGHVHYTGSGNFALRAAAKWPTQAIAVKGCSEQLLASLAQHQQGRTTYRAFCQQAAAAGVYKWTVDLVKLTCTYYDVAGHTLVEESIPVPENLL